MSDARTAALPADDDTPITPARLFGYLCMCLGMFMAILDIQIVAASIGQIQAGLSASPDEISWVQTSYLIAEVLMIPLTGLLSRALSTRVLFSLSAAGFTAASLLCATATSIEQMIVYRALQGFLGGAMIPTVYAASFIMFGRKRSGGIVVWTSMLVILAPTLGPALGGWISETLSWHWLFLVNLVPGIIITVAAWTLIDIDRPQLDLLKKLDLLGLVAMVLFLAAAQYVIEEGSKHQWFDDDGIRQWTMVAVLAGIVFFWRALTRDEPIVNLRPFANPNFFGGAMLGLLMGTSLFAILFLMPLYLVRIAHYNAAQVGSSIFVSGLVMLLFGPIAGELAKRIDLRLLASLGFAFLALSAWSFSQMTSDWRFAEMIWPQVFRGIGLMFCVVSVSNIAFASLPQGHIKDASGLFTLMRNLGGAFGVAAINTLVIERTRMHWSHMMERLGQGGAEVDAFIGNFSARLGETLAGDPVVAAHQQLSQLAYREASVLAYADCYRFMTVAFGLAALIPLLLRKPATFDDPAPAE